jgi:hypothetical protein
MTKTTNAARASNHKTIRRRRRRMKAKREQHLLHLLLIDLLLQIIEMYIKRLMLFSL